MTVRSSCLLLACLGLSSALAAQSTLDIDLWYGNSQVFGANGHPQRWVNIQGTVTGASATTTLWMSLNGGPERRLSLGPDQRRLAEAGDFNADIDAKQLLPGLNSVLLRAADGPTNEVTETVSVLYDASATAPDSLTIDWQALTSPQQAAQMVDGRWVITPNGLRTAQIAYDRVFAVGGMEWRDFEILVPFTVHSWDPAGINPISGKPGIGVCARWVGHFPLGGSGEQPLANWRPYGGGPWHAFSANEQLRLVGWDGMSVGDPSKRPVPLGVRHFWKVRCETLDDGNTLYAVKMWQDGQSEPVAWDIVGMEGVADLAHGGAIFIAHHVDATFGNITIRSLDSDGVAPTIRDVEVVAHETSASLVWKTDELSRASVDLGLTSNYEVGRTNGDGQSMAHRVRVTGLQPGTTYRLRPVATDGDGNTTEGSQILVTTLPAPRASLASDDFSAGLGSAWSVSDAFGTHSVSVTNGQLTVQLPGDHDRIDLDATRIVRPTPDEDFDVIVKFDSALDGASQIQGIVVEQDSGTALLADLRRRAGRMRASVLLQGGGHAEPLVNLKLPDAHLPVDASPIWTRLVRRGHTWAFSYSLDAQTWRSVGEWESTMIASRIGILAGNQYQPVTIRVDSFTVAPKDTTQPQVSGLHVAASDRKAVVSWTTDEPASSSVAWNLGSLASGVATSSIRRTSHFLEIDGLAPDADFSFTVSSADSTGNRAVLSERTIRTASAGNSAALVSDAFDEAAIDFDTWTFVSPKPGASASLDNGNLVMMSSGAAREAWTDEYSVPRLLQTAVDGDLSLVMRLNSAVSGNWQSQGVLFEQDETGDLLRAEFLSLNNRYYVFLASVRQGRATTHVSTRLSEMPAPQWLRIVRRGDEWTLGYSFNGLDFVEEPASFVPLRLRRVGPYIAHSDGYSHTAQIASFVNEEDPPPDLRPPDLDEIRVASNDSGAIVRWSTDEPATSAVEFGPDTGYGSTVESPELRLEHEIQLTSLQAATDYHFRVRSTDPSSNSSASSDMTFRTALVGNAAGLRSDSFDDPSNPDLWRLVDPSGDAELLLDGNAAELRLSGAVGHDAWKGPNGFARLLQPVFDEDFVAEITFGSDLTASVQIQGLIAEVDDDTLLRAEFHRVGSSTRVFVATIDDAQPVVRASLSRTLVAPMTLRVSRTGDAWRVHWSPDGSVWELAASFNWAAQIAAVGPFAGNSAGTPFTARIESFVSAADPLPDLTPPTQEGIRIASSDDSVLVRWRTDEPALGSVEIGTTAAYGNTVQGSAYTQEHEVLISGLTPETVYHLRVSSEDVAGGSTVGSDRTILTALAGNDSGLRPDSFDTFDETLWAPSNPLGDATIEVSGGSLLMSAPSTVAHEVWSGVDSAPKLMQDVFDADFGAIVRFASLPSQTVQAQGLLFLEEQGRGLRVELLQAGGLVLFVGFVDGASASVLALEDVPPGADATHLRVDRAGTAWTVMLGDGNGGWATVATVSLAMTLRQIGVSAGNTAGTPLAASFAEFSCLQQPLPDSAPPSIEDLELVSGDDALLVRWRTNEPAIGRVIWGAGTSTDTVAYSNGSTLATSHEVVLSGLQPASQYAYQIASSDASDNEATTPVESTWTAAAGLHSGARADAFDQTSLSDAWKVVDPRGSLQLVMTGSAASMALLAGTSHDAWTSGITVPRLLQPVMNRDFDIAARFATAGTAHLVMHGLCAETESGGFLRVELLNRVGQGEYLFAAYVEGGSTTIFRNHKLGGTPVTPASLRLRRSGDSFEVLRSTDGANWSSVATFNAPLSIRDVGVFIGNPSGNAHAVTLSEFSVNPTP